VSLMAINTGCPNRNCVVRVIYPTKLVLKENDRVAVFGAATLDASGPATQSTLPEIRAHMLLR
jgi:hypothetical protein